MVSNFVSPVIVTERMWLEKLLHHCLPGGTKRTNKARANGQKHNPNILTSKECIFTDKVPGCTCVLLHPSTAAVS